MTTRSLAKGFFQFIILEDKHAVRVVVWVSWMFHNTLVTPLFSSLLDMKISQLMSLPSCFALYGLSSLVFQCGVGISWNVS